MGIDGRAGPVLGFMWNEVRVRLKAMLSNNPEAVRIDRDRAYFLLKANNKQLVFCVHLALLDRQASLDWPLIAFDGFHTFYINLFDDQCNSPLDWSLCSTIVRTEYALFTCLAHAETTNIT